MTFDALTLTALAASVWTVRRDPTLRLSQCAASKVASRIRSRSAGVSPRCSAAMDSHAATSRSAAAVGFSTSSSSWRATFSGFR